MGRRTLQCKHPATLAIYNHLKRNGYADSWDVGYSVLNYRDTSNPNGKPTGQNDGKVQCEEIWETSLSILDNLGRRAYAKESSKVRDGYYKKYQELRRVIETKTNRPIPWILEVPNLGIYNEKQRKEFEATAHQSKQKILKALDYLGGLLNPIKNQDEAKYQRCLIACLYWFVLVDESGKGTPNGLESFLRKQKLDKQTNLKIRVEFSKYLKESGGGLGLDPKNFSEEDAKEEAIPLETVKSKKGWCTERSKVWYAVLNMAGIEAFFIEPRLSIEYFRATKKPEPAIPFPGHIASGVGVKIVDEKGKKNIWIIDVTLGLLEADYIVANPPQWKVHPYWILSLRQYWMADLSNLGLDQQETKRYQQAKESFELALQLGKDSTAHHAMGNYPQLIQVQSKKFFPRSPDFKKAKYLTETSVTIYPHRAYTQFNKGVYFFEEQNWKEAAYTFIQSIKIDPRHTDAYQNTASSLYNILFTNGPQFREVWNFFKQEIRTLYQERPSLKQDIENGLNKMCLVLFHHRSGTAEARKLIELINNFKKSIEVK